MTQQAKILIIPSLLSIKGEELSAIFCNVVTIKAKVPTHHEQAPSYDEKKVISALIIHGTGIVSEYVHMYKCVHVFINTLLNACFKHRLLGQYHDSESVGFIRFVLVYTAIVLNLYLGVFYTTFHERLGNIVGTSLAEFLVS